ncbi:MAG TPA: class I SAM-dependent methyltransferase [Ignavibacteriales bacterium]|nr:MAG: methyltransferase type 11 [Ignavibacteria bacterium GWA2_35_9]OGU33633.1 MAG: methyltransferase type 11 [Ignavibacteria bacterium GWB2_35_6b]OGU52614.1 MAG: methyltransferase type 11 [Ignavibacteria bacterium GWC2_36_12]HCY76122.1 class I SAM-dependent methyltransferase [Ignavibacteriales bacterium]
MKIRESGMPEETYWESFFNAEEILSKLKLDDAIFDVVEFGSGYGTFTIPAAKIIKGNIFALDIDSVMINRLKQRSEQNNLTNINILQKDFVNVGTGLKDNSVDYVMLFNILHAENPDILLNEAYRILKQSSKLGVIHWIYSSETPRGPSLDIRPTPVQCSNWIKAAKFKIINEEISLPPYHYGILAIK